MIPTYTPPPPRAQEWRTTDELLLLDQWADQGKYELLFHYLEGAVKRHDWGNLDRQAVLHRLHVHLRIGGVAA